MRVTFYHDHDLDFEHFDLLQMQVVEVMEEVVEVLAAGVYTFPPLVVVVEVVVGVTVVEVGEYLVGQRTMEEVEDLAEVEVQPELVPKGASRSPNFAPLVVQQQKLEGQSAVAVGYSIPFGIEEWAVVWATEPFLPNAFSVLVCRLVHFEPLMKLPG